MESTRRDVHDWPELHRFEDQQLAYDMTTAIMSMEFQAALIDLGNGEIVAGIRPSSIEREVEESPEGPWSLRVPEADLADLESVLEGLILERDAFEIQYEKKEQDSARLLRVLFAMAGVVILIVMLLNFVF